ncbi:signal transducer and activator of transcription B-like [Octopus sinensis]|uniref:Signal transducer and activator of transcription B-like n=1 Tax=Octopus sinensis TaxID=2607531 RepID=A0A7E6EMQ6_9MOLL|nr:signal transducer and activator of transcription B-like [Octopus sinensis]
MSLKDWAEKHLKLISEFITPPVTPVKSNSRNNCESSNDDNDSEKIENRLPLSQWAEKHVKLISEGKSDIASSRNIPVDTVNNVQFENNTSKTLNVSEWAERHARRVSSMASNSPIASEPDVERKTIEGRKQEQQSIQNKLSVSEWAERHARRVSSMVSNSPIASEPDVERKRMEKRKQEHQCIQNKLSVSEWAERHARKISSMTSNVTTNPILDSPQNNDESKKKYKPTSTVKIAESNISIKNWAEKHVNIISEMNSNLNSGSRRNSFQINSLSGENTFNSSKVSEDHPKIEHKNRSLASDTQTPFADNRILNMNLQISSPNDAHSPNHQGNVSKEDKLELQKYEENQIDTHSIGDLPEETEDCESNTSKSTETRAMDKVDIKFKDVIDETDKNELIIQDKQTYVIDSDNKEMENVNDSELNPDVHNKKEGIEFMEAKSPRQKLQDASTDCSEICEVDEIPHLSNTDLNRWAERHFEKILGAHTQSDSQKQISSQVQQDIFEGDKRRNRKAHLDKKSNEHRRSEIISESSQAETIQNIDNKSMTKKSDSKPPESESDSSSDICFESCYEHFPESPTNSQTNDLCSQSFVIDTDDMVSAADNSLTSDILGQRFVFDDNSNVVDSDTDMYSDQFNLEEISVKSHEPDSSMTHDSNLISKYESFTNQQSSNSTTSVLHSTCNQLNLSENTLASSKLQTLDSEDTQSQFHLSKNNSSPTSPSTHIASHSLTDVDNSNITHRKHKPSFDSSLNNSVSPKCQAISSSNNNEDTTDIIQCQTLSLREENVLETDNDNNLINNPENKVKFDDVKVTAAITASTSAVECSIKPITTNDGLPRLKSFHMNVL